MIDIYKPEVDRVILRKMYVSAALPLGLLWAVSVARASTIPPELQLVDGGGDTITVYGDGTYTESSTCSGCSVILATGSNGQIVLDATLGGFISTLTTGTAPPTASGPTLLSLGSVDIRDTQAAGDLTITFSDTGYSYQGPFVLPYTTTMNEPGTSEFLAYFDASDTLAARGTKIADSGTLTDSAGILQPQVYSNTLSGTKSAPAGPYSLTEVIKLHIDNDPSKNADYTSSFSIDAVPEPSSFGLVAAALLVGLGAFRRKVKLGNG